MLLVPHEVDKTGKKTFKKSNIKLSIKIKRTRKNCDMNLRKELFSQNPNTVVHDFNFVILFYKCLQNFFRTVKKYEINKPKKW